MSLGIFFSNMGTMNVYYRVQMVQTSGLVQSLHFYRVKKRIAIETICVTEDSSLDKRSEPVFSTLQKSMWKCTLWHNMALKRWLSLFKTKSCHVVACKSQLYIDNIYFWVTELEILYLKKKTCQKFFRFFLNLTKNSARGDCK